MTRIKFRETIGIHKQSIIAPGVRSSSTLMEVPSLDSSDKIMFQEQDLGVLIVCIDPMQEIFVPWSNIRCVERDIKMPTKTEAKTNKKK